jgi:hypothetical protein
MAAPTNLDWLFHLLGWVLGAAGAVLLLWALFWDCGRGRRRCPKCWYDMGGVPGLKCPECGREARGESRLHKTRRHLGWAAGATTMLIAAHLTNSVPDIRARGWWAAAPRVVLLMCMPLLDRAGPMDIRGRANNGLYSEYVNRFGPVLFGVPGLHWWESWIARPICRGMLSGSGSDESRNLAALLYVSMGDGPIAALPERAQAPVLIARAVKAYATCQTCFCTGDSESKPFLIAFERSTGRFRFEYLDFIAGSPQAYRYVIWRNENGLQKWWAETPDDRSVSKDICLELAASYGVSSRASGTVPELLLRVGTGVGLIDMLKAQIAGSENIQGHPCWRIDGTWWNGRTRFVWIDKDSFVIRRSSDQFATERYATTEFNGVVDPSWFTFDPEKPELSPLK